MEEKERFSFHSGEFVDSIVSPIVSLGARLFLDNYLYLTDSLCKHR